MPNSNVDRGVHVFREYRSRKFKVPPIKQCLRCDTFIFAKGKSHRKKYCQACSYKAYLDGAKRYREKYPDNCAAARFRRRTRMKNARYETVTLEDVINEHGKDCHICGDSIDFNLQWPHPQSKSLDHVRSLAKGGGHELANVKLAHLTCNQRKSDKV